MKKSISPAAAGIIIVIAVVVAVMIGFLTLGKKSGREAAPQANPMDMKSSMAGGKMKMKGTGVDDSSSGAQIR